jgi:tetratricopeptide (TPR) repeat protein
MLELESMPLPKGAPQGFDNAVGSFQLDVSTSLTKVQEGDPLPLDIRVSGSGNLDTLRPPKPVDSNGWKLYDATTEQRGDERRELAGQTVFHQFMRPLELKPAIPAFRLVYFDPKDATYKTLTSEPIPLQMTPAMASKPDAATPPEALPIPVERMTDILGVLRTSPLIVPGPSRLPDWSGHALGGLLALGLIAKALWMRYGPRLRRDPARDARMREIRAIKRVKKTDDTGFLLLAGQFIERWLGEKPSPEIQAVLAERDAVCFRKEKPGGSVLAAKRREHILNLLRKASMAWLASGLLAIGTGQARAGDLSNQALEAYDSAKYDDAISCWLQGSSYEDLTADTLYNIGNACYRAGSPGHAALYYRRALARDPAHQESRQNLRFIERKCGTITIHRPDYQYALARFPLALWKGMLWTGIWLCVLATLVFPATRPGAKVRVLAVAALASANLLASCGGLGWWYFPDDAEFADLGRQAVIIVDKATLHADAARTSPEVIDAPPGSLCEIIRESGRWAYVAFATKTRGWIPVDAIDRVVPVTAPVPPTIRKPKADGKSA